MNTDEVWYTGTGIEYQSLMDGTVLATAMRLNDGVKPYNWEQWYYTYPLNQSGPGTEEGQYLHVNDAMIVLTQMKRMTISFIHEQHSRATMISSPSRIACSKNPKTDYAKGILYIINDEIQRLGRAKNDARTTALLEAVFRITHLYPLLRDYYDIQLRMRTNGDYTCLSCRELMDANGWCMFLVLLQYGYMLFNHNYDGPAYFPQMLHPLSIAVYAYDRYGDVMSPREYAMVLREYAPEMGNGTVPDVIMDCLQLQVRRTESEFNRVLGYYDAIVALSRVSGRGEYTNMVAHTILSWYRPDMETGMVPYSDILSLAYRGGYDPVLEIAGQLDKQGVIPVQDGGTSLPLGIETSIIDEMVSFWVTYSAADNDDYLIRRSDIVMHMAKHKSYILLAFSIIQHAGDWELDSYGVPCSMVNGNSFDMCMFYALFMSVLHSVPVNMSREDYKMRIEDARSGS